MPSNFNDTSTKLKPNNNIEDIENRKEQMENRRTNGTKE